MKNCVFIVMIFLSISVFAQNEGQNIKGKITDSQAKYPLIGVNAILFQDTVLIHAVSTDENGMYKLENILPGRYKLVFQYITHKPITRQLILTSGKEVVINVEMEESIEELEQVVVKAYNKSGTVNDMATVSTRMFDAEETGRYAGSRQDPARMASNFAGVQGADDSRNDIVVRGNSPLGVLYRVDGVNIPNPSHFAVAGSTGGPASILNNKTLANSDFYTGAFPAEFGNSLSGVFDLRLRNGNQDKHEFSGQFGVLGTELSVEGPINKDSRASYLGVFRYSNFGLLSKSGIDIGTNAIPKYFDGTFRLNFPLKDGASVSFFGIGGKSNIDIVISNNTDTSAIDIYSENDRDQYFGTWMGVLGATYSKPIKEKMYFQTTFSTSFENQHTFHEYVNRHVDSLTGEFVNDDFYDLLYYDFSKRKVSNSTSMNYKLNKKNNFKIGVLSDYNFYDYKDSLNHLGDGNWDVRWNYQGNAVLLQMYTQWQHKFTDDLTMNIGWNSQYYTLNGSSSFIEPRAGLKWSLNARHVLSAAVGMHSQIQPEYTYFYMIPDSNGIDYLHNIDIEMSKSNHYVLGYDFFISENLRFKAETYYQQLYNIPVEVTPSSFSSVNQGSGFVRFFPNELQNTGTGTNYGVELTLEKFFSKNYFFMLTGSIYESLYKGSDGIERNTDFNGNFALNVLGGTEFKVGSKSSLGIGSKVTWAGGKRYGIVDSLRSELAKEVIFQDDGYNEQQFKNYFRADLKLSYKINAKKVTHEIALDIVNLFDTENLLTITYAPRPGSDAPPFRESPQLGRLPLFFYKIDF